MSQASNFKETREGEREDDEDEGSFKIPQKSPLLIANGRENEKERERKRESCAGIENELKGVHLNLIILSFCIQPPHNSIIYILSQMKGHLIQFTSNGIATVMEVNVLLEIHVWASRVFIFDEIRGN